MASLRSKAGPSSRKENSQILAEAVNRSTCRLGLEERLRQASAAVEQDEGCRREEALALRWELQQVKEERDEALALATQHKELWCQMKKQEQVSERRIEALAMKQANKLIRPITEPLAWPLAVGAGAAAARRRNAPHRGAY
jgi:hypothetical protein